MDRRTKQTFKWLRNRTTAHERALQDVVEGKTTEVPNVTIKQVKQSEKDRVRRIKNKIMRVLAKPREERKKLVSAKWLDRFDEVNNL